MKNTHTVVLVMLMTATIIPGCAYYKYTKNVTDYKYQPAPSSKWNSLDEDYILIVHAGNRMVEINNYSFNDILDSVNLKTGPFDDKPRYYYDRAMDSFNGKATRPLGSEYKLATRQIHIFVNQSDSIGPDSLKFALADISRVDMLGKAANVPLIVAGSAIGLFVGVPLIILAIACNCPHIYIENENGLELANSLYTGATSMQLERYDYKMIPDYHPDSSRFSLSMANELNEIHYTNLIGLISVLHPGNTEVIADQSGKLHTIQNPVLPEIAENNNHQNILTELSRKDDYPYSFDPDSLTDFAEAYLSFSKPAAQSDGKLILHLKNTKWAGYTYKEFTSLFGDNYADWIERNKNKTKEEREKWMNDQGITLQVEIKTDDGWKELDQVNVVGDISYNSIVIPCTFSTNKKIVEIRLRGAFKFWELDYAAMDYSTDLELNEQILKPSAATGTNGENFVHEISLDDDLYMENAANHTATTIVFDSLQTNPDLRRTLILIGKGYYTSNANYTGKTYRKELMAFRKPGELSRYSYHLYHGLKDWTAAK